MTQYEAILSFLRKNKQATVRQLLQFTNYPSSRIHEMTDWEGLVPARMGGVEIERIQRLWTTTRDGRRVRLYKLEKVR